MIAVLACAGLALDAVRPPEEARTAVLVAARSLDAGTVLGPGDFRELAFPLALAPDDAAPQVEGRALAVGVPAGTPLVEGVLASEDLVAAAPEGTVASPVRLADPELAALLGAGDRVDVLSAGIEGGTVQVLAERALVLAGPAATPSPEGGLFGGATPPRSGLVVLAVSPQEASDIAAHSASSVLSAVLVP